MGPAWVTCRNERGYVSLRMVGGEGECRVTSHCTATLLKPPSALMRSVFSEPVGSEVRGFIGNLTEDDFLTHSIER